MFVHIYLKLFYLFLQLIACPLFIMECSSLSLDKVYFISYPTQMAQNLETGWWSSENL